ncbi:MAG: hypothetical protein RLZZ343_1154 [Actinomycetota bacterium]
MNTDIGEASQKKSVTLPDSPSPLQSESAPEAYAPSVKLRREWLGNPLADPCSRVLFVNQEKFSFKTPTHFAVLDIETTGLSASEDQILQVAVVLMDWPNVGQQSPPQGRTVSEWVTYVRPTPLLSSHLGPQEIHGIRRRQLIFAPSLKKSMTTLAELTNGCIVVAHNAPFDTGFLYAAARSHNIELNWAGVLCTLNMSRRLDPDRQQNHKLATVCERYGVALTHAHDALHDTRATAEVLICLLTAHGIVDPAELVPFVVP